MRWHRLAVVVLALGAALAGCNGLAGEDPDPTRTVTPAPTVTPIPTPVSPPEGGPVFIAGRVDPESVAGSHERALLRQNYTLTITQRVVVDGTTRRNVTRRRTVAAGGQTYAIKRWEETRNFDPVPPAGTVEYWYNGTGELARLENGSVSEYATFETSAPGPLLDPPDRRTVADLFSAFEVTVTDRTETERGTVYRVESERMVAPERLTTPSYVGLPRNGSLEARVGEDGVVYEYRVAYTAPAVGVERPVQVVRRARVEEVGETAVEPPAWVGNASVSDSG